MQLNSVFKFSHCKSASSSGALLISRFWISLTPVLSICKYCEKLAFFENILCFVETLFYSSGMEGESCRQQLFQQSLRSYKSRVDNSLSIHTYIHFALYIYALSIIHNLCIMCSGSVVVTAHDSESGRPGSDPEWGLIYYEASITAQSYPSLHPSGVVHRVPEQLNIKAVTGACKLIDGCSLVLCSTTVSVVSASICHINKVNSIA